MEVKRGGEGVFEAAGMACGKAQNTQPRRHRVQSQGWEWLVEDRAPWPVGPEHKSLAFVAQDFEVSSENREKPSEDLRREVIF